MNRVDKEKENNKRIFEQFLKSDIFDKNISPDYGDKPDVIVEMQSKRIGIEITGLVMDAKQELESIKGGILNETKMQCIDKGAENIQATVIFSPLVGPPNPAYRVLDLRTYDRLRISRNLAEQIIIKSRNLSDDQRVDFEPTDLPEISKVFLYKNSFTSTKEHRWQMDNADSVITSALNYLQDTFTSKADKIQEYLKKCDECWLLIHANRTKPSRRFKPDDEALSHIYETRFKRAFFLEQSYGKINELNTSQLM